MSSSACKRRSVYLFAPRKSNPSSKKVKLSPCRPRRRFSLQPGPNSKPPATISFLDGKIVSQRLDSKKRSLNHRRFSLHRRLSEVMDESFRKQKETLATSMSGLGKEHDLATVATERALFTNPWAPSPLETFPLPTPKLSTEGKKSALESAHAPMEIIDLSVSPMEGSLPHDTKPLGHEVLASRSHATSTMNLKGAYVPANSFSQSPPESASAILKKKLKFRRYEAGSSCGQSTVWYESCAPSPISEPSRTPAMSIGDIYLHFHHQGYQLWVLDTRKRWTVAYEGFCHPHRKAYSLRIRSTGEPLWLKQSPN